MKKWPRLANLKEFPVRLSLFSKALVVAAPVILLTACSGGDNANNSSPFMSRIGQSNNVEPLPNVDSECVDANIGNLSRRELLGLIGESMRHTPWSTPTDDEELINSVIHAGDDGRDFSWGPIPANGLANYIRAACDLLPQVYNSGSVVGHSAEDILDYLRHESGAMFLDPITNCTNWQQVNLKAPVGEQIRTMDGPSGSYSRAALDNICPQLK